MTETRPKAEADDRPDDRTDAAPDPRRIARILSAAAAGDREGLSEQLAGLHPADIADLLEQISDADRESFLGLWSGPEVGEVLSELDEGLREEVITQIDPAALTAAVRELDTDDVVDLVEDMDAAQRAVILDALEQPDRYAVEQSLAYPEWSAGRLMQRDMVTVPAHWTVGQTVDYLREADDLPEQFYHVTLVDPRMVPVANVTLGRILSAPREAPMRQIAEPTFITIPAEHSGEDVAYAFNQYHLISAPVVDRAGRMVGVITIDDAMSVLSDENEEDMLLLAGVSSEGSVTDTVLETVRARMPWLAVNLCTAILAASVIAQFEDAIEQVVALAVLMPIVASMGGNAGTQSLAVAVRALATRDLTAANVFRVVRREALVGLSNGFVFAAVMGLVAGVWFGSPWIGGVLAAAMVVNLLVAGLAGILVPLTLNRLKFDPALASGTFVTTVTDVVGFLAFLGLASLALT